MKILILTLGTRGDVQPYIALGIGLTMAGHDVLISTSERFESLVTEHGLQHGSMGEDLLGILETDLGREMIDRTNNFFRLVKRFPSVSRQIGPSGRTMLRESWDVAQSFAPDIVVFHPIAYGGQHIAERLGVQAVMALPLPMMIPTSEMANFWFPDLPLGGSYRRLTYGLHRILIDLATRPNIRDFRERLGLSKTYESSPWCNGGLQGMPVLFAFSEHILPRPSDWPTQVTTTGYWFLGANHDWAPSRELAAFLDAGPQPVYVGFGSMAGRDPEGLGRIVIEVLQEMGLRGIIATGWGGLGAVDFPETVLRIDGAPHDWLFPRTAAVVHHGGAGSTAAGLRAGKPTIVVPFFGDQPFWGQRVFKLGVGPRPIPREQMTKERLSAALRQALTDPNMKERAQQLGQRINDEDGVAKAVSVIEELRPGSS